MAEFRELEDGGWWVKLECPECGQVFVADCTSDQNCIWDDKRKCMKPKCPKCGQE